MVIIFSAPYTLFGAENRIHTLLRELFGDDQLSEGEESFQNRGDLCHLGVFLHRGRISFPQDQHRGIVFPRRLASSNLAAIKLTGLAMILGFLAKTKASRPNITVLRREYDLYHADKRAIEFDENGWQVLPDSRRP